MLTAPTVWFDEGPQVAKLVRASAPGRFVNIAGIDTAAIDRYRQGAEITQDKHATQSIVKIGTGELGGFIKQDSFGMGAYAFADGPFADVESEGSASSTLAAHDGVLEPFVLTTLATSYDESQAMRGTVMGGTEDVVGRAAQIVSQWEINVQQPAAPFVDSCDVLGGVSNQVLMDSGNAALILPHSDEASKSCVVIPLSADVALQSALNTMTPASDTYLKAHWTSAATGFVYGATSLVDSIAFGGQDR